MRPVQFDADCVLAPFYRHKVLSRDEHLRMCGCSVMTAWRVMHAHGYLTSYNFNAKYYTLADIPRFDDLGLWSYRRIRFSRFGSLPRTLHEMIERSESGMSVAEVEELLGVNHARTTLARLFELGKLKRERLTDRLLYFSPEPARYQQQRQRRQAHQQQPVHRRLPEPDRIVEVLVERILRPRIGVPALAQRLACKGMKIAPRDIEAIFAHYDLEKKSPGGVGIAC